MQQPPPNDLALDPALAMYGGYYPYQQQSAAHILPPHLNMTASLSSPSSHGSEMAGTPPTEQYSLNGTNSNGKRPPSSLDEDSRKKLRKDDDGEPGSPSTEKADEVKAKPTRGSRCAEMQYYRSVIVPDTSSIM